MKKYLIYILVFLITIFLLGIGYFAYNNKDQKSTQTVTPTEPPKARENTPEPAIAKASQYEVPILMYHYIRDASAESELGQNLSVWPENFELQIQGLKNDNYVAIKMSDLADPDKIEISKILSESKKPIALTFDDGYEDAYTNALPVLQKYQMTGTFYIIRDYVGHPEYMNQTQVDKLSAVGMEIGSHSLNHPSLEKLGEDDQRPQIFDSRLSATSFCYPAGKYNEITVELVRSAGYSTAVTTQPGIANETSDLLELPRIRVTDSSGDALLSKINNALKNDWY